MRKLSRCICSTRHLNRVSRGILGIGKDIAIRLMDLAERQSIAFGCLAKFSYVFDIKHELYKGLPFLLLC